MRYSWTEETFGFALRDAKFNAPWALLLRTKPREFYVSIIDTGMPQSGPYRKVDQAAAWAHKMLVEYEIIPKESTFGEVPIRRVKDEQQRRVGGGGRGKRAVSSPRRDRASRQPSQAA